jgi:hypothetical protein
MRALRVGDLVLLREEQDDTFVKHHGAGIITQIQKFNQEYKYPHITVKWLRSEESLKFLEKDLMRPDDS